MKKISGLGCIIGLMSCLTFHVAHAQTRNTADTLTAVSGINNAQELKMQQKEQAAELKRQKQIEKEKARADKQAKKRQKQIEKQQKELKKAAKQREKEQKKYAKATKKVEVLEKKIKSQEKKITKLEKSLDKKVRKGKISGIEEEKAKIEISRQAIKLREFEADLDKARRDVIKLR